MSVGGRNAPAGEVLRLFLRAGKARCGGWTPGRAPPLHRHVHPATTGCAPPCCGMRAPFGFSRGRKTKTLPCPVQEAGEFPAGGRAARQALSVMAVRSGARKQRRTGYVFLSDSFTKISSFMRRFRWDWRQMYAFFPEPANRVSAGAGQRSQRSVEVVSAGACGWRRRRRSSSRQLLKSFFSIRPMPCVVSADLVK